MCLPKPVQETLHALVIEERFASSMKAILWPFILQALEASMAPVIYSFKAADQWRAENLKPEIHDRTTGMYGA